MRKRECATDPPPLSASAHLATAGYEVLVPLAPGPSRACHDAKSEIRISKSETNPKTQWRNRKRRSGARRLGLTDLARGLVLVIMGAAQEGDFVEHVLLEPFEPEINHRRHEERHHLGENETADNHEAERASRRGILTEA